MIKQASKTFNNIMAKIEVNCVATDYKR